MIDPIEHAARAAAHRLAAEHGPGLTTDVEAALHARGSTQHPEQYLDPISLGSLIVSIASMAWTIYSDLKKKHRHRPPPSSAGPSASDCPTTASSIQPQREQIIDIIVDETVHSP